MSTKLYVGNLSFGTDDQTLGDIFAQFGNVLSARVIHDRETGRSKGFGFVEMEEASKAEAAIAGLNGKQHDGRALTVNEARPQEPRDNNRSRGFNRGFRN